MSRGGETMKPAVSRGDTTLKIDSWPQAVVLSVGVLAAGGMVAFLVSAGWSAEAIIGFGTLALGLFAGQAVQARKTATIEAKTDQQTETLEQIAGQTNGKHDTELDEIADRAAVRVIAAYRRGDLK